MLFSALKAYLELLRDPASIRRETINYALQLDDRRDQRLWSALAEAIEFRPLVEYLAIPAAAP